MRIGALAKALGTTPESVRFYERQGLLPGPSRKASGYRDYGPAEADRLRLLLGLRQLDLPLDEAARLATLCADGHCDEVSDDLRRSLPAQRTKVRRQIAELRHLEARLTHLERNLAAGGEPRPLISRQMDDSDESPIGGQSPFRGPDKTSRHGDRHMKQLDLKVTGMDCVSCERRIQTTLSQLDGVVRSSADHKSGEVTVVIDPARASADAVRGALEQAGFKVGL